MANSEQKQIFEEELKSGMMVMELWRNKSESKSSEKCIKEAMKQAQTPLRAV